MTGKRALVAYATKYGSTAEIAEAVGRALTESGLEVDVRDASVMTSVEPYSAVILGSAVYMGRWRRSAMRLLRRSRHDLSERPVWLFSSGPVGEQDADPEKAAKWTRPARVERLASQIGARDHVVFGGCVSEDRGGFVRRNMAKNTPPELRDRRDWDEIRIWAKNIGQEVLAAGRSDQPSVV